MFPWKRVCIGGPDVQQPEVWRRTDGPKPWQPLDQGDFSPKGLHEGAGILQTPLPFCTSWCYHNLGPRADLCGSWPGLPLAHVCVTLSAKRPDSASCRPGEGPRSNVGNRKRKWTRPGLGERMEGTEHNICPPSLSNHL